MPCKDSFKGKIHTMHTFIEGGTVASRTSHTHTLFSKKRTSVKCLQVKLSGGLGRPQAQVDAIAGVEAGDGVVVGHSSHLRQHS
eukprot:1008301-Pelagomonas_calceolata.AAC.11